MATTRTKEEAGREIGRKREKQEKSRDAQEIREAAKEKENKCGESGRKMEKAAVRMKGDRGRSPPFQEPL